MDGTINRPVLVEPDFKYYLNLTLKKCHQFKESYYNTVFNIVLFVSFCVGIGIFLYVKYKGKLTPDEVAFREMQKQQYILDRIKNFQISKQRAQQELITGLPHWENEYVI
jgi:hypothetical protein